ncbi:MAG TPA: phosphate ABC transporter permease subunit PstC, partial [Candidatus Dormibacteraeota bacterium]|nr:phosphate ABC transporter permease subunit PstC [Candidatus Dormibacteraeota bacterium]
HVSLAERFQLPRVLVTAAAGSMIVIVVLMLGFIAWNGIQIFTKGIGLADLFSTSWGPQNDQPTYGILPFIAGTVGVTALAVVFAAPLSVGLALFMSEVAPAWARSIVQPSLEVFVGIPSVVWGWMGITILVPFLRAYGSGIGFHLGFSWFAGSLVLTIMILPTITSVAYDVFRSVPGDLRTASLALGTTRWQMMRHVVVPASVAGVLTAIVLGMTRAAGEALAVQMVIGNRTAMPSALTDPVTTLTSQITLDMGNTVSGETWNDALWTMSLVLLLISIGFVLLIRVLNRRRQLG